MRRTVLLSWFVVLAATACGGVWAAQRMAARPHLSATPASVATIAPAEDIPLAAGRVVALDAADGRVIVAHRGIGRFYIEPGTTVFYVQDPTVLTGLTPGDKIRFDVVREGRRYSITRIENSN